MKTIIASLLIFFSAVVFAEPTKHNIENIVFVDDHIYIYADSIYVAGIQCHAKEIGQDSEVSFTGRVLKSGQELRVTSTEYNKRIRCKIGTLQKADAVALHYIAN